LEEAARFWLVHKDTTSPLELHSGIFSLADFQRGSYHARVLTFPIARVPVRGFALPKILGRRNGDKYVTRNTSVLSRCIAWVLIG